MTISIEALRDEIAGRRLPGGTITVEPHEAFIADRALRSTVEDATDAHPTWFVIASLRCLGITVEELCALAHQGPDDTLLFGRCRIDQREPLRVGGTYAADASIREVATRSMRDGSRLDSVEVEVVLRDGADGNVEAGSVTSVYLFKRGDR